jgi:hypothetical protein
MRNRRIDFLENLALCLALLCSAPALVAQTAAAQKSANSTAAAQSSSRAPDLSGNWAIRPGGTSWDPSDPNGSKPEQLPMTPWGLERLRAAKPPFGANQSFDPNDPHQRFCDPPGPLRMYSYPWQFSIVQTPAQVYMLFEYLHVWRLITMNQPHPKDGDSTWLGDSVGHYDGDTLVIDTIGYNDKTWLDMVGHPHSEQLHTVERLRRVDHDTLELQLTIEDPKAYTQSFNAKKTFKLSSFPMGETMCSLSEDQSFQKNIMDRTVSSPPAK